MKGTYKVVSESDDSLLPLDTCSRQLALITRPEKEGHDRLAFTACALRRSGTTARISFALRICRADIEMARFGTCDISAKILAAMLFSVDNGGRQLVRCSERSSLGGEITPISHLKETVMWVWTYTTGCLARSMRAERTCKL